MREYPEFSEGEGLLRGAPAIAQFIFGTVERAKEIYPLARELPIFRLAGKLTARPTSLARAITEHERAGVAARRDKAA
jgi:hypothetical protein